MGVALQNLLIKVFTWSVAWAGWIYLLIKEYMESPEATLVVKIGVPVLVAFFIVWTKYYESWQQGVERRLIAIATAGELGKVGTTGPIMANIFDQMGLIVPVLTMALIYIIGGTFLFQTGIMLLKVLVLYMIPVVGKVIRDINSRKQALKDEAKKEDEFADLVAKKVKGE